ncbi:MAG TPA: histidine kinase [Gemmatimonadaceae bacterium]|jgi:signal transduction histidine kinase/ligand-binding sensor domain-containing protein
MARASLVLLAFVASVLPLHRVVAQDASSLPTPPRYLYHAAWTGESAPQLGGGHRLVRSPDGYLWIGGINGIARFDGVRFTVIDSTVTPLMQPQEEGYFNPLVVDASGTLWISTPNHTLLAYRDGKLRLGLASSPGDAITLDGAGRLWLYGGTGIYLLANGRAQRVKMPAGAPDSDITTIVRDTGQGIWIGTRARGLWHVVGDRAQLMSKPDVRVLPLLHQRDGTMWALGPDGGMLRRLVNGQWQRAPTLEVGYDVVSTGIAEDASGAIWIGTNTLGLLHWSHGQMDTLRKADGLSDDAIGSVAADGDGNIWASTRTGGIDQLRPAQFVTLNLRNGLPIETASRFAEDESGAVWANAPNVDLPIELIDAPFAGKRAPIHGVLAALPHGDRYDVLAGARGGGVWLGPRRGGLIRYRSGHVERWTAQDGMPSRRFYMATEMRDGAVWLDEVGGGFGVFRDGRFKELALPGSPNPTINGALVDEHDHLLVAVNDTTFLYEIVKDSIVRRLGKAEGIVSPIASAAIEHGDTLWAATDSGFIRVTGGRGALVKGPAVLSHFAEAVQIAIASGYLWLVDSRHVARFSLAALNEAADGKKVDVTPRVFGQADGVRSPRNVAFALFDIVRTRDGRVWISTPDGLAITDPSRDVSDHFVPSAHVEEIDDGDRVFRDTSIAIPPNPDRIGIHYTVTNLFMPERTRIQVMLDGVDRSWVEGNAARVATYTQLRPGKYHFRVRGWNGDGIATPAEARLAFVVLPAWYQSLWFRVAAVLAAIAAIVTATISHQRRRTRDATDRIRAQFETTFAERNRIARELHDTLLQSFAGIVLQLDAIRQHQVETHDPHAADLAQILMTADAALVEARQSVWDMRGGVVGDASLDDAIQSMCRTALAGAPIELQCTARGTARTVAPHVEAAVLHVSREAVRNACAHADCRTISVDLTHREEALTLCVHDDGIGIQQHQLAQAAHNGHFGIVGMRERAAQVGGTVEIHSEPGMGTTIELVVPYRPGAAVRRSTEATRGDARYSPQ